MMENPEVVSSPDEVAASPIVARPKRTGLIAIGVFLLIALLAGAAFVGGRLLNQAAPQNGSGSRILEGGPAGGQGVSVEVEPAKGLPNEKPTAVGLFAERKDNSIYVTLGTEFAVHVDRNGNVDTQTNGNGDKLEIVVTSNTTIYKSVTPDNIPPGGGKVQQQLAPGSLDELGSDSIISAWGERRGDRVIATFLLYEQPNIMGKP
jgi:hypothetical protein